VPCRTVNSIYHCKLSRRGKGRQLSDCSSLTWESTIFLPRTSLLCFSALVACLRPALLCLHVRNCPDDGRVARLAPDEPVGRRPVSCPELATSQPRPAGRPSDQRFTRPEPSSRPPNVRLSAAPCTTPPCRGPESVSFGRSFLSTTCVCARAKTGRCRLPGGVGGHRQPTFHVEPAARAGRARAAASLRPQADVPGNVYGCSPRCGPAGERGERREQRRSTTVARFTIANTPFPAEDYLTTLGAKSGPGGAFEYDEPPAIPNNRLGWKIRPGHGVRPWAGGLHTGGRGGGRANLPDNSSSTQIHFSQQAHVATMHTRPLFSS